MVFSSLVFLCIFLPCVWILHTLLPNGRARNAVLLLASLLFYAYGEPVYVFLMLGSALCNYVFALLLGKHRSRLLLAGAVIVNIGALCVFKYSAFLVMNVNAVTGLGIPAPQISLPIGISFFTFQALSYVIDVYRGEVRPQRNFARILLYISLFPQLIAGPIVRYRDIEAQITERTMTLRESALGMRRFIGGLAKKVLISNAMAAAADQVFNAGAANLGSFAAWIGMIAYLMHIYFDFSGYSDMAIGLGRMFGFTFRENFNYPYAAAGMQDFWRRWHMSLSGWFRDYVYIPLGGNRKGRARTVLNRLIVFFLTGLWHGANWTFVVWGLYHGCFLLLEEYVPAIRKMPKFLLHLYTVLVTAVGFVFFRADSITEAGIYLTKLVSLPDLSASALSFTAELLTPYFLIMLAAAALCCGPLAKLTERIRALDNRTELTAGERVLRTATFALAWLVLVWCVLRLSGSSYNPFIYFRF